jgi:hypothetical protein
VPILRDATDTTIDLPLAGPTNHLHCSKAGGIRLGGLHGICEVITATPARLGEAGFMHL